MQLRLGGRKRKKSESRAVLTSPDNNHSRGENLNTIARIETAHTVNTRSRSNSAWNQSAPISPVELEQDNYDKDDHYPPLPTFLAPSPEPTRPPPIFAPSYRRFSFPIRPSATPATRIINPINTSQKLVLQRVSSPSGGLGLTNEQLNALQVPDLPNREQTSSLAVHERTPYTTPSPAGLQDPQIFAPRLSQIHRGWVGPYPTSSPPTDEMASPNPHLTSPQRSTSPPIRSTSPIIIHNATPSTRTRSPAPPPTEVFPGANALRLSMESPPEIDILKSQRRNLDPSASDPTRDSIDLDLERGHQLQELRATRPAPPPHSRSHSNSTTLDSPDDDDPWDDSHPCYPHLNPYVDPASPLYASTRVIRVPRDYMLAGDIVPGFSNIYPQIMEPFVSEERFRNIIAHVNRELKLAFDPFSWRNVLDGVLGVVTFWLWEDLKPGGTAAKRRLDRLEAWLEDQSRELGGQAAVISLRRSGYANIDFQIPNPISQEESPTPSQRSQKDPNSRPATAESQTHEGPWASQ